MELAEALTRPEGPRRTAAIVAWVQGLFVDEGKVPVLVGDEGFERALDALQAFDAEWPDSDPDTTSLENWSNNGPDANTP